ncbi:MAG: rhomboid family intramembrane serine protease [Corynebacterium provencense]|jgi:membrane associated rhomboid family serine protease|uniref:rhomboid family intramembrane serine protease n=1 Tax=Corynebacterium provencense TaxID=1737425 RepID=UPI002989C0F0|nr:rhomboid family intramembrane serine protease [Corynebacterium provencense]
MDHLRRYLRDAPVCATFVLACAAVFCVEVLQSRSLGDPVGVPGAGSGAAWALMVVAPEITGEHQWWRLATSALVHMSITHLLLNMLLVALVGRELEKAYGAAVTAVSVLLCAVGGSLAALWFSPDQAVGGASTVGYGMFAMLVGLAVSRGQDVRAPLVLIAVNLAYTVTSPGVSLAGHLGGLAAGGVIALVLLARKKARKTGRRKRGTTSTPWSSEDRR